MKNTEGALYQDEMSKRVDDVEKELTTLIDLKSRNEMLEGRRAQKAINFNPEPALIYFERALRCHECELSMPSF
jgi:hypothetical protein